VASAFAVDDHDQWTGGAALVKGGDAAARFAFFLAPLRKALFPDAKGSRSYAASRCGATIRSVFTSIGAFVAEVSQVPLAHLECVQLMHDATIHR
jgi:hypothetical protein